MHPSSNVAFDMVQVRYSISIHLFGFETRGECFVDLQDGWVRYWLLPEGGSWWFMNIVGVYGESWWFYHSNDILLVGVRSLGNFGS